MSYCFQKLISDDLVDISLQGEKKYKEREFMKSLLIATLVFATSFAFANTEDRLEKLESEINALKETLVKQDEARAGIQVGDEIYGLGAGASKVYRLSPGVSLGGYGEIVWRTYGGDSTKTADTDVYRFIPYIGYKFNDNLVFNAELEFEHGSTSASGKVVVEFAYLDHLIHPLFNVRVGHVLAPVGLINQLHEPIYFPMVDRPSVERYIIPSTWSENGILLHGENETLRYSFGFMTAPKAENFKSKDWVRSGRPSGSKATNSDHLAVARFDYFLGSHGFVGVSGAYGSTNQSNAALGDATLGLVDLHAALNFGHTEINLLTTQGTMTDTDKILAQTSELVGKKVEGSYVTLKHNIMPYINSGTDQKLKLFAHYEVMDLHKEVIEGQTKDKTLDQELTSVGLNYHIDPKTVLKYEYQIKSDETGKDYTASKFGVGFVF